jgi:hypothetical protein
MKYVRCLHWVLYHFWQAVVLDTKLSEVPSAAILELASCLGDWYALHQHTVMRGHLGNTDQQDLLTSVWKYVNVREVVLIESLENIYAY